MNLKRFALATLAVFVFIFVFEMAVHGFLLSGVYQTVFGVWRSMAEMEANMPLGLCFQLAVSAWSAYVFAQLYPKGGTKNGLLFGLFFGVFAALLSSSWYLWINVPGVLGISWFISGIVEWLGIGYILGLVYKGAK